MRPYAVLPCASQPVLPCSLASARYLALSRSISLYLARTITLCSLYVYRDQTFKRPCESAPCIARNPRFLQCPSSDHPSPLHSPLCTVRPIALALAGGTAAERLRNRIRFRCLE